MSKVTVTIAFDSVDDMKAYFGVSTGSGAPAAPPVVAHGVGVPGLTAPTPEPASQPAANTQAPASVLQAQQDNSGAAPDHLAATRAAMAACVTRISSAAPGQGPLKAREVLKAFGFTRAQDVTPDKAAAVIDAFNKAA